MKYSSAAAALASLVLASPVLADDCANACTAAHNACLSKPDANRSTCASEYASCLGYNPYGQQPFVTPTACSKAPAAAPTAAAPAGACGQACWDKLNECRNKPVANLSLCGSNYASCLGYNPFARSGRLDGPVPCAKIPTTTTTASAEDCAYAQDCSDKYNACRGRPSANRAVCASEYATCLGYNPFGPDGSLVTPSACSRGPGPAPTFVPGEKCGKECWDKFNACRGKPDANLSTCTSEYYACLGHNNGGKHDKPAECSHGGPAPSSAPRPSSTPSPRPGSTPAPGPGPAPSPGHRPGSTPAPALAPDACAKDCWNKYNACRGKPGANMSACGSDYATCIGYNPFTDGHKLDGPLPCRKAQGDHHKGPHGGHKGNPPVVTGHGDRVQPALAVLALAAAAML